MTITEQILERFHKLPLDEQKKLVELLSVATGTDNAVEVGNAAIRERPLDPEVGSLGVRLAALGKNAEKIPTELPGDLAANHDYYLHGLPKKS